MIASGQEDKSNGEDIMGESKCGSYVIVVVNYKKSNDDLRYLPFKDGVLGIYIDGELQSDRYSYDADTALEMIGDGWRDVHVVDISDDPRYIRCAPNVGCVVSVELYETVDAAMEDEKENGSFADRYHRCVIDAKMMYVNKEIRRVQGMLDELCGQRERLLAGEYAIDVGVGVEFC